MKPEDSKVRRAKKVVDAGMNIPLAQLQESIDLNDKVDQLVSKDQHQITLPKEIETIFKAVTALKGEKGDSIKGDDGYTPIKGKDYFTNEEIDIFLKNIQNKVINGKDGRSPIHIGYIEPTNPQKGDIWYRD